MKYQDYIKLGFKRINLLDKVEFNRTGYHGFILTRKINERMAVEVHSGELDKPKLVIQKIYSDFCNSYDIKPSVVKDIFKNLKQ
jgi:hypothetical protein